VEFRVLGPLVVRADDRELPLGGPLRRAVLAALLLEPDRMVPTDRLVRVMYGEELPSTAVDQVRQAIYHLRKALPNAAGGHRIVTEKPGYRLRLAPDDVLDLDRFDAGVARARKARAEGNLETAAKEFRAALAWWRGDALADLADLPVSSLTLAIEQRRLIAVDERIEVDLALGRHGDLLPELSDLVERYPLQDRMWSHLLRALYRSGRRAEALAGYQRARAIMVEENGLDPAPELADLHRRILADDPSLEPAVLPLGERPTIAPPPCPYRALEPYGRDDHDVFFGRRAAVDELVSAAAAGTATLVGPSGSGKSSLLLAGVLPELDGCTATVVRPSDDRDPQVALAGALRRAVPPADLPEPGPGWVGEAVDRVLAHTGDPRLVVVLDQAEELLVQDDDLVGRFVEALYGASAPDRLLVLATLRADLLGPVLQRPALAATLGRTVVTLGAMGPAQLRKAITGPLATRPDITFQDGLVDRIVADVGTEPGGLALLGLTLTLLWDEQVDGVLTHQSYDDLGRVGGALADHAETEWRRHDLAADEATARRLFGELVRVGDGDTVTRRVVVRDELDHPTWRLAERLSTTRLLVVDRNTAGEQTVELAHEALIDHWPRLRSWIEEDVEFHRWRETLRSDLTRWDRAGRDPALLMRGVPLREGRRWRAERPADLALAEVEFIRRSERHDRSTWRRSRTLRAALAVVAVLALVLGGVFVHQRSAAEQAAVVAGSRDLAARSDALAERDPAYAALLAVAAHDTAPTEQARAALFARYRDTAGLSGLRSGPTGISRVLASADGRTVAAVGTGGGTTVWIETPGAALRTVTAQAANLSAVDLAADGGAVWLLEAGRVTRLDLATGERRELPMTVAPGAGLAVSADGTRLLVWDGAPDQPRRIRERDVVTGRESAPVAVDGLVSDVYPGPPGVAVVQTLGSEGLGSRLDRIDLATGAVTPLTTGQAVQVARDGTTAVGCDTVDDVVTFTVVPLDGRTPAGPTRITPDPTGFCQFAVDPTGTTLVQRALDAVTVVDLASGRPTHRILTPYLDRTGPRIAALRRAGGAPQLIVEDDTRVALVDVTVPEVALPDLVQGRLLWDGTAVAGVSDDGRNLVVQPVRTGGPAAAASRPAPFRRPQPGDLVGGPSVALIADRVADDRVALYRLPGLEPLAVVTLPSADVRAMFFDNAGRLVTWVGRELTWWDPGTGAPVRRFDILRSGLVPQGSQVSFQPVQDPEHISLFVTGRTDVTVVDTRTGLVVDTLPVGPGASWVAFQGPHVMVYRDDQSVEVWNADTRQREFGPLPMGGAYKRKVGFLTTPGQFVVADRAMGVGTELRTFAVGRADAVSVADLGDGDGIGGMAGDGTAVAYVGYSRAEERYAGVLRLDPAVWRAQLCTALGGRDFTADERAALPPVPDEPVCR
jgi:DNA-binding SARP family transcriptional activator/energy-coupling factor transporter ATP-binding protein EcfA2